MGFNVRRIGNHLIELFIVFAKDTTRIGFFISATCHGNEANYLVGAVWELG